jgi:hypothetical protein
MVELEIHIDEPQIIVNVKGTRLTMTFQVAPDGQSLVENSFWTRQERNAPISLNEFRRSAWQAAHKKAREIGWISALATSSDNAQSGAAVKRFYPLGPGGVSLG